MVIGTLPRSVDDSFAVSIDWSLVDVFSSAPVTSAPVSVTPATTPALTLGAVSVSANVSTFRVSGGVVGTVYTITAIASNGTDTLGRSIRVETDAD